MECGNSCSQGIPGASELISPFAPYDQTLSLESLNKAEKLLVEAKEKEADHPYFMAGGRLLFTTTTVIGLGNL